MLTHAYSNVSMIRRQTTRRMAGRPRRGAIVVLFAICLVVILGVVAVAIDLGYVSAVRGDLQGAADAGALAGAGVLLEGDDTAVATATRFAQSNLNNRGVQGGPRQQVDVAIGHWDVTSRVFTPGGNPHDAVQVTAESREASMFFGRIWGRNQFPSQARAIAAYRPRDIMLVLDVSGSMHESRNGIRKIDELRDAVAFFLSFIRSAQGQDRVGFTYYSTDARMGMGLSFDLNRVQTELMRRLRPDGWTDISDGMRLAREEMNRNRRPQAAPLMVVLTDGAANTIQPENIQDVPEAKRRVREEADLARRDGLPVFTMALDSLTSEVDVALMAQVATTTGSESFHIIAGEMDITGNRQLREAFRRVALNRPLRLVD